MTTFAHARGIPVFATDTAKQIGAVQHFVVDGGKVAALHVDGGKHGRLVEWSDVKSFGDDAVVVAHADALREATNDREASALRGDMAMVGKRALTDRGDELGEVIDVTFDADDGTILSVAVGENTLDGERLVGVGSYAVVVRAGDDA